MTKFSLILIVFFASVTKILAQSDLKTKEASETILGLSEQVYPAGLITTLNTEVFVRENSSLIFRVGGNFANRKDFSPYNDNEKGSGFGGSLGYRKYFHRQKGSFLAGINTDVWNMWIDWQNNPGTPDQTQGQTNTLVLQPWLEGGYLKKIKNSPFQIGMTAGLGREINVITNGKEVGQGWMFSALFHFRYLLKGNNSIFVRK